MIVYELFLLLCRKSTTIIGLKRGECYHRVYFMYKQVSNATMSPLGIMMQL